jgi:hypothetical protein
MVAPNRIALAAERATGAEAQQYSVSTEQLAEYFGAIRQCAIYNAKHDPLNQPYLDLGEERITSGMHLAAALSRSIQTTYVSKITKGRERSAALKATEPVAIHQHLGELIERLRARAEEDSSNEASRVLLDHVTAFEQYLDLEAGSPGFTQFLGSIGSQFVKRSLKRRAPKTGPRKENLTQTIINSAIFGE